MRYNSLLSASERVIHIIRVLSFWKYKIPLSRTLKIFPKLQYMVIFSTSQLLSKDSFLSVFGVHLLLEVILPSAGDSF